MCTFVVLYNRLLWKPAPAKLSLFPSTVKSHLFPHYHGLSTAQTASKDKVTIKLPSDQDAGTHSTKKSTRTGSLFYCNMAHDHHTHCVLIICIPYNWKY